MAFLKNTTLKLVNIKPISKKKRNPLLNGRRKKKTSFIENGKTSQQLMM